MPSTSIVASDMQRLSLAVSLALFCACYATTTIETYGTFESVGITIDTDDDPVRQVIGCVSVSLTLLSSVGHTNADVQAIR